ncbi:ABC transporter ATP-binding protein [Fusibacter sp. 3D3]|uniref:ABC transporter ATP-binding protein n=1 Tax=Fusibacter sp. 3D3 TaxID=1048380 RepID=UPI00085290E5|nr:ABC transporter ATP-binding protein [Fusibacter sp. 3D3]GAU78868.1 ferric iron ABC transporter, ATP-binding protein [Fusibacter sp. 3D3]
MRLLDHIFLNYEEIEVFNDFSLNVMENKITCIIGPSGCGKTSILNMLSGFVKNFDGEGNKAIGNIGYIFQEDRLLPWETVYQNIRLVRDIENREEILELLKVMELVEFRNKYPSQLSGGMRQRSSIARGFYFPSQLLLMDEPFKSLDFDLKLSLISHLGALWKSRNRTILFVTHDIDEALLLGHEVLILSKRPTNIVESFMLKSELGKRSIQDKAHINLRDKVLNIISKK